MTRLARSSSLGHLDAELPCILGMQTLPAAEFHGVGADDASDGLAGESAIEHIETDVPARGAHGDEIAVDVVPEREPRAAARERFQLPSDVLSAPVEFAHFGRIGALHLALGHERRRRSDGRELCAADVSEAAI